MQDALAVAVMQPFQNASQYYLGHILAQSAPLPHVRQQVPASAPLLYVQQILVGLEGFVKTGR